MTASGRLASDRALAIAKMSARGGSGNKDSVVFVETAVKSSCVVQYVLQFNL